MNTVVLKFGGSSVADNEKLKIVANKIIDFKRKNNDVVVVVSAQGKRTDELIREAKEIAVIPNEREMDALLSVGEIESAAKLAILLNELGYRSISLNGFQSNIHTNNIHQKAKIESIDVRRITKELKNNKVVIVTGFQGIDKNMDVTTLGRGGSDTSAVAISIALKAKSCYIFSDVDGIYSADPNRVNNAKKLNFIDYSEMANSSKEGAQVLHDRCVELAEKYNLQIIAASTYNNKSGTAIRKINDNLEENEIKSIIQNDDILMFEILTSKKIEVLNKLLQSNIRFGLFEIKTDRVIFTVINDQKDKVVKVLEKFKISKITPTTKISIVGRGISDRRDVVQKAIKICDDIKDKIYNIDISAYKISIEFGSIIDSKYLNEIHQELIFNK